MAARHVPIGSQPGTQAGINRAEQQGRGRLGDQGVVARCSSAPTSSATTVATSPDRWKAIPRTYAPSGTFGRTRRHLRTRASVVGESAAVGAVGRCFSTRSKPFASQYAWPSPHSPVWPVNPPGGFLRYPSTCYNELPIIAILD